MKKISWAFFLGLALAPAADARPSHDYVIVPGVRVGPIQAKSSQDELLKLFGHQAKPDRMVFGMPDPAPEVDSAQTVLLIYPDDPDRALTITWCDEETRKGVDRVFIGGRLWRTANGVGLGTTVETLNRLNGRPFAFYGDGWEVSGHIDDWKGGALERSVSLKRFNLQLSIARPDIHFDHFSGEKIFLSHDRLLDAKRSEIEFMEVKLDCPS